VVDESEITAEIAAAKRSGDAARLRTIAAGLDGRTESWVTLAKIKAIAAGRALEAAHAGGQPPATTIPDRSHWLSRYGLPRPDGRPLHRYALSDAAYAQVEADLRARAASINAELSSDHDAALFVLWAAEWFRRNYAGGLQRWADVGRAVNVSLEQSSWRKLADRGLRYWRLPELRLNGMHRRLAAIARQGGFPVAAIGGAQGGWAANFLQKLIVQLLEHPEPTTAVAEELGREHELAIPGLWRHEEIFAVSAELAIGIVELRREAEAGGVTEGVLISAWLDKTHPDWRRNLPLAVDDAGARQLVDGLISVERLKGGAGAIRARRFLLAQGSVWREQVELHLDGDLVSADPTHSFKSLARDWSRLRLFASDEAAQYISGELAVVEPSQDGRWTCMASRPSLRFDVPAHVPLTAELRGEGVRVMAPFLLPGGEAGGRELRVCTAEDVAPDGSPTRLEVIGYGSGGYRAEPIYLDAPATWVAEPHETDSACRDLSSDANSDRRLWEVFGAVVVGGEDGDRFLVRAGQTGDQRDQIVLDGAAPEGCVSGDGRALYCGVPTIRLRQGPQMRMPRGREIWWRLKGEREWRSQTQGRPLGSCEFAWRDEATLHVRCKTEAIVLPVDFGVRRSLSGPWVMMTIDGWPHDVTATCGEPNGGLEWRFHREHTAFSHFEFDLRFPGGSETAQIRAPLKGHAWIYEWTGRRLQRDGRLSLATLNQFVARTPSRIELWAELLDANRRPVPQANARWIIDEELPMSVIADDLAVMLRSSGRLDARVRLDFNDSQDHHWYVSEFAHELDSDPAGLTPRPAVLDPLARIVGRPFADAARETDFGPYGEREQLNPRPIDLNPGPGAWLIYLRANDRVLSRPRVVNGSEAPRMAPTALGRAMLSDPSERSAVLAALVDRALADPGHEVSREIIRSIAKLAVSLNGLPPSTFDVFRLLETFPLLGPMILYGAAANEIEPILRLADNLKMAWCLVPQSYWKEAWEVWGEHFSATFPDNLGDVAKLMTGKRAALLHHEPSLAPLLGMSGSSEPITVIANSFLNRSGDRIRTEISNPFRPRFEALLPNWPFGRQFWRAADAPILAARIARGEMTEPLGDDELTAIKDIARAHPRYFTAAFAAQFGAW